jgi:hypothetical protein
VGWGRGGRRGRGEREEGAHHGDPNTGDHRLQNLGHHGGERGGREEVVTRENQMREGEEEGGAHGEGTGARGAPGQIGPGWAGLGRAGSRHGAKTHDTHNHQSESDGEPKSETRRDEHAIKHDIRQRNMLRHDATLMTTWVLFIRNTDTGQYTALKLGRRSEMGKEKGVTPEFCE